MTHVVDEYDRSVSADPEFSIISVYETYADKLEKYGVLHIRGLLQRIVGESKFPSLQEDVQSVYDIKAWDTVIEQTGVSPIASLTCKQDVSLKKFQQNVSKNLKNLPTSCCKDPERSYWSSIDHYASELMRPCGFNYFVEQGTPIIPSNFVSHYGLLMKKVYTPSNSDSLLPPLWRMHGNEFGGPRNILLSDNFKIKGTNNVLFPGMCSPHSYYYFGTLFTSFPHHFEDFWMPSVNFLYHGAEKQWIALPQSETKRVWETVKLIAKCAGTKPAEKKFLLTPQMLRETLQCDPVVVHQNPGDVVISASGATHGGFNMGNNFAEAVNFCDTRGEDGWLSLYLEMEDFYVNELEKSVPHVLKESQQ